MQGVRIRDVFENQRFKDSKKAIEPDAKRFDEAMDGVTNVIARRPDFGRPTNKPGIFAMPTHSWGTPIVVYYSYDENRVYLEE